MTGFEKSTIFKTFFFFTNKLLGTINEEIIFSKIDWFLIVDLLYLIAPIEYLLLGTVQCLDKSFCHNTFHSTSSTTTVKIKISGESIQIEFQIMIMKKNFGKNKKKQICEFF